MNGDESFWRTVRERAVLLLVIAGLLIQNPDDLEDEAEEDEEGDQDGLSPRDRRDTELAVALAMLNPTPPPPPAKRKRRR